MLMHFLKALSVLLKVIFIISEWHFKYDFDLEFSHEMIGNFECKNFKILQFLLRFWVKNVEFWNWKVSSSNWEYFWYFCELCIIFCAFWLQSLIRPKIIGERAFIFEKFLFCRKCQMVDTFEHRYKLIRICRIYFLYC